MAHWEGGVCQLTGRTVCSLDATVTNVNDMQATVSLTGYSWSDIVDAWGFDLWVGNGTVLGASGVNGESKTHPRWSTTTKVPSGGLKRTVTVPRAWGKDTTLAVWCRYSDSNPVKYHGRLDASVTIPRMTSPVHAVSAVADKAAVLPGQPVSLTVTDSTGASKAWMDHFEIWCGGKLAAKARPTTRATAARPCRSSRATTRRAAATWTSPSRACTSGTGPTRRRARP